ncbi:MAG: DEAD/DEAH box helicase [Acidobacteriota bacterium]
MIEDYLAASVSGSALVRMPTGSGKSGIIAVASRCLPNVINALVVCPHEMLRDQLAEDVKQRFFDNIGVPNTQCQKDVRILLPSKLSGTLKASVSASSVFVGTIQALQAIYRDHASDYQALRDRVDLVIFDEGHREPAPEWAETVRMLKRPTLLCTATPYRNDLKLFDVDSRYIATLPYHEAEQQRFIRKIEFRPGANWTTANQFVGELLDFWRGEFKKLAPSDVKTPRAIIRCTNADAIRQVVALLQNEGETALGLHETFVNEQSSFLREDVPKPSENRTETFWVHQYKLLEGLDARDFCVLALFHPLKNARSLVQQVGRIIRNPGRTPRQRGFVLSATSDRQEEFWNGYLKYERHFEANAKVNENRQLFDASRDLQPEFQYVEGNFRELFDLKVASLHDRLRFAFSAVVFKVDTGFDMGAFETAVDAEWIKKDLDIRRTEHPDANTSVRVYIAWSNASILAKDALMEFRLGLTVARRVGNYVFFNDSEGYLCEYLRENAERVSPEVLEKLYSGTRARLSNVSVINSDIGSYSIRRRMLQARSIADTAPGLSDHAQFCSTAQGYTEDGNGGLSRRYVGFTRARISDQSRPAGSYADYANWLDSVAKTLDAASDPLDVFGRFAFHSKPPSDPVPRNILIDFDGGIAEEFHCEDDAKQIVPFETDDLCHDVAKGKFEWKIGGQKYEVSIHFDSGKKRYELRAPALQRLFIRVGDRGSEENVIAFLNRNQAFRVVPESAGCIYAHGRFYKPRFPLYGKAKSRQIDLLQILETVPALASAHSEKGRKGTATASGWEKGSIFELIDRPLRRTSRMPSLGELNRLMGCDILVCDDLNKETADFIAYRQSPKEVIFIHAKDGGGSKLSATAFQEVCGQAVKNLDPLVAYSQAEPKNLGQWGKPWKIKTMGTVDSRIRAGNSFGTPAKIWDEIRSGIRDPNTTRQVWIVLGQGFSRKAFESEHNLSDPPPETIQILYLLQSTWNAVSAIGAQLKILCSE